VSFLRNHEKDDKRNIIVYLLTETHSYHRFSSLQSWFHFEKDIYYELSVEACLLDSLILAEGLLGTCCLTRKMKCCATRFKESDQIFFGNCAKHVLCALQHEADLIVQEEKEEKRRARKLERQAKASLHKPSVTTTPPALLPVQAKKDASNPPPDKVADAAPSAGQTTAPAAWFPKVRDWIKSLSVPVPAIPGKLTNNTSAAPLKKRKTFGENAEEQFAIREAGRVKNLLDNEKIRLDKLGASSAKPTRFVYSTLVGMAFLLLWSYAFNYHGIAETTLESDALRLVKGQITMLDDALLKVNLSYTRLQESSGLTAAALVNSLGVQTLLVATLNDTLRNANLELQDVKRQLVAAVTGDQVTTLELHDINLATMHESLDAVHEALREMTRSKDVLQEEVLDCRSKLTQCTSSLASAHSSNSQYSLMATEREEKLEGLKKDLKNSRLQVIEATTTNELLQAEVLELEGKSIETSAELSNALSAATNVARLKLELSNVKIELDATTAALASAVAADKRADAQADAAATTAADTVVQGDHRFWS